LNIHGDKEFDNSLQSIPLMILWRWDQDNNLSFYG